MRVRKGERSGRLLNKVTVYYPEETQGVDGSKTVVWTEFMTTRGSLDAQYGFDQKSNSRIISTNIMRWMLRQNSKTKAIKPTFRIVHGSVTYQIQSKLPLEGRQFIYFDCRATRDQ